MELNKFSIKIIGNGVQYWTAQVPESTWYRIIHIMKIGNLSLSEVIFDLDILNQIGFESWTCIPYQSEVIASDISIGNKIEIKLRNKKILNINSIELLDTNYLFPLYNIEKQIIDDIKPRSIAFGYHTTGVIQSFKLTSKSFRIEDLKFRLSKHPTMDNGYQISQLIYDGRTLKTEQLDFNIRSFFAHFNT
jgi:hypothetical protein